MPDQTWQQELEELLREASLQCDNAKCVICGPERTRVAREITALVRKRIELEAIGNLDGDAVVKSLLAAFSGGEETK